MGVACVTYRGDESGRRRASQLLSPSPFSSCSTFAAFSKKVCGLQMSVEEVGAALGGAGSEGDWEGGGGLTKERV